MLTAVAPTSTMVMVCVLESERNAFVGTAAMLVNIVGGIVLVFLNTFVVKRRGSESVSVSVLFPPATISFRMGLLIERNPSSGSENCGFGSGGKKWVKLRKPVTPMMGV